MFLVYTFVLSVVIKSVISDGGYHAVKGIPAAMRIYRVETTAAPGKSEVSLPSSLAAHPFLAGVVITVERSYSVCGASVLTNTRAITAAHCWYDGWKQATLFTLVFGSEHLFVGGIRMETTNVTMHPGWNPASYILNDLAIIGFGRVDFNDYIQSIALPSTSAWNYNFLGYWTLASGYGKVPEDSNLREYRVQTDVYQQVIPTKACIQAPDDLLIYSLCTLYQGPMNTCITISGGPLSIVLKNQRFLIGVSSFGDYECNANRHTTYSRISLYLPWILSKL